MIEMIFISHKGKQNKLENLKWKVEHNLKWQVFEFKQESLQKSDVYK